MNIRILHLLDGARQAAGLTVIIDVFRAFSTACYVFGNGAERIIPVGTLETAYQLKRAHPEFILMGERHGAKQPGFDYGNSPAEIEQIDFTGRTVVQTTSSGTQGIANARQASEILTGSFCNAGALAAYIEAHNPEQVSLVCMGNAAIKPAEEDTLCAQWIKGSLEGHPPDFDQLYRHLKAHPAADRFFDPAMTWSPERDFELCLALSRFNFVLRVEPGFNGQPVLHKISM